MPSNASTEGFGLDPNFAATLAEVIAECRIAGYEFRVSQGLRTPQTQADYYCQWDQRSPQQIDQAASTLEAKGAPWIAGLLRARRDMPRKPNWQTNALPGAGWHQWGLAADCYCYRDGKMVENGDDPCYAFYAKAAQKRGLTAGLYFSTPDAGHVQGPKEAGASKVYAWSKIDEVMKERFSEKVGVTFAAPLSSASTSPPLSSTAVAGAPTLAASSAGTYFKDNPVLVAAALAPSRPRQMPASNNTLKSMVRVYNTVGGLLDTTSAQLGIDPVAMLSVWLVESSGAQFVPGRPILRIEIHKLWKYWGSAHEATFNQHFQFGGHDGVPGKASKNHAFRADPAQEWKKVHIDSQDREYAAFDLAQQLAGREAACLSSSWGGCQVMGFNYGILGYASASGLADGFAADERWHVLGFADFCAANNCLDEIKAHNWTKFGSIYNGDGSVYGPKIAGYFGQKAAFMALPFA